jgi:hypothetical protein
MFPRGGTGGRESLKSLLDRLNARDTWTLVRQISKCRPHHCLSMRVMYTGTEALEGARMHHVAQRHLERVGADRAIRLNKPR